MTRTAIAVSDLVRELSRPQAYPHPAGDIEVHQTHISVVFLAGAYAYKVKKAVDLGFLDFTTLDDRLRFCHEEVRLNRRLAGDVYLGVVPIVETEDGLVVDGRGEPVEHAVKMERLPPEAALRARLERGDLAAPVADELGRRVAAFHRDAAGGPHVARYGRWTVVAAQARENLAASRHHVGTYVSAAVFQRLADRLERRLEELRPLIEARAEAQVPRNTHGDLHLEHVYLFPERAPPADLVVIDCIEFNERFRYADPVADMAFLSMDLRYHGRPDLADRFVDAYFAASGDAEGRTLLPFYESYRSAVRAKVAGLQAAQSDMADHERRDAERSAGAHWLLALAELEEPDRRPALVLVGGLPGTGKSTLAGALGERAGFTVLSSDRTRKQLAGVAAGESAAAAFGDGIYTPEWNDRTYEALLRTSIDFLRQGERVVVDASFREEGRRRAFLEAAVAAGVRPVYLRCSAAPATVRGRLEAPRGGASDADPSVYEAASRAWEPESAAVVRRNMVEIPTDGPPKEVVAEALGQLRARGLVGQ